MSSSKPKDDSSVDIEQQFILRMPEDAARYLAEDIDLGVSFKVKMCFFNVKMAHFVWPDCDFSAFIRRITLRWN